MAKHCHAGLDGRCRDQDGRVREKNGNTQVGTLREMYGASFARGIRSNAHLSTLLERSGSRSLSNYLRETGR